ncbi:MAG: hypothetical protein ACPF8V_04695 [Luteibaculum sp.]
MTQLKSVLVIFLAALLSSCATLVGGSRYNAFVQVSNVKDVTVTFPTGRQVKSGMGTTWKRKDANSFSFLVSKEGCEVQEYKYITREFKSGALVGTLVLFGLPGLIVDAAFASWWEPNEMEKGIVKADYKNFVYQVDYTGCETEPKGGTDKNSIEDAQQNEREQF